MDSVYSRYCMHVCEVRGWPVLETHAAGWNRILPPRRDNSTYTYGFPAARRGSKLPLNWGSKTRPTPRALGRCLAMCSALPFFLTEKLQAEYE